MPDQESLIERLFDRALQLPTEQRDAFLDRECADDPTVRAKVLELLDAYEQDTEGFLPRLTKGAAYQESPTQLSGTMPVAADSAGKSEESTLAGKEGEAGQASPAEHVGDHEIIREIVRGGMGVVYEALHLKLKRIVALKMVLSGKWASEDDHKRFMVEAEAAAKLKHPGIVSIYDLGEHDGQPYFSMEFVDGPSLNDLIRENPLGPHEAAEYVKAIAEAMKYAHAQGVLHRDLKPQNILVDSSGQPKITDFGLAKRIGEDSELTATGQILATPSYMAPEQALGEADQIGPRTDVYALGGILYALLVGRPPFSAQSTHDVLMQVLQQDPVSPRILNPTIPVDLETICLKLLEKEPERRYESAQEVAEELGRFLEGVPVQARRISTTARAWRWCRRKPALAGLWTAAALLVLMLRIGGPVVAYMQSEKAQIQADNARMQENKARTEATLRAQAEEARAETKKKQQEAENARDAALAAGKRETEAKKEAERRRQEAEAARDEALAAQRRETEAKEKERRAKEEADRRRQEAEQQELRAYQTYYLAQMNLAQRDWERGKTISSLLDRLDATTPERTGGYNLRGFEWHYWNRLRGKGRMTLRGHTGEGVAFSPDGKRIATVRVWDVKTGREVFTTAGSTDRSSTVKLWDAATGQDVRTLTGHTREVGSVWFSSDGERVTSASADGSIRLWNRATGSEVHTLEGLFSLSQYPLLELSRTTMPEMAATDSALGVEATRRSATNVGNLLGRSRITIGAGVRGQRKNVVVVDDRKRSDRLRMSGPADARVDLQDNRQESQAEVSPKVDLLDSSPQPKPDIENSQSIIWGLDWVTRVAVSPDSQRIATANVDNIVKLWDGKTGKELVTLKGHTKTVNSVSFSPDGKRIASASSDTTVKLWDDGGEEILTLRGHKGSATCASFSSDGRFVASGSADGVAKIWDATTRQETATFDGHTGRVNWLSFSPDSTRIASSSDDGTVRLWDTNVLPDAFSLKLDTNRASSIAFGPDGNWFAAGWEKMVKRWNVTSGKEARSVTGHSDTVTSVAINPEGTQIASGSADMTVKLWDDTGVEIRTLQGHVDRITHVSFNGDGEVIASASDDGIVKLWDATSGQESITLDGSTGRIAWMSFSQDNRRLATASRDERGGTLKVWDATTGHEMFTLKVDEAAISLSPDGRRVAVSVPGTVKVVDVATGQQLTVSEDDPHVVWSVSFSPDGQRMVSAGEGWTVKVWNAVNGQEILTLLGHTNSVSTACFSPNGQRIVTASRDGTVKVWDAATGLETLTLQGHTCPVESASFSSNGQRIISIDEDGTLKVWDARPRARQKM